jgi:hypothetical protein
VARKYVPLVVAGESVGLMQPAFAAELAKEGEGVFALCRSDETNESHAEYDAEYEVLPASTTAELLANPHRMLETKTFRDAGPGNRGKRRHEPFERGRARVSAPEQTRRHRRMASMNSSR